MKIKRKLKIKRGDKVQVIAGKNRGKKGEVLKVFPFQNWAIVSGVNLCKKHTKPNQNNEGGIVYKELPIDLSNLSHIDPKTGEITKVGYKFLEDGRKVRISKKSGEMITKEVKK